MSEMKGGQVADHENNLNQEISPAKDTLYVERKQYYDYKSIKVSFCDTSLANL